MTKETRSDRSEKISPGKLVFRLFLFFVMYMIYKFLTDTILRLATAVLAPSIGGTVESLLMVYTDEGPDINPDWSAIITGISFVAAGLMIRSKAMEYDGKYSPKKEYDKKFAFLTGLITVSAAIVLNILIYKLGIAALSSSYEQVAENQYSCSFIVGLLVYGFMTPFSEEFMFRGILYNGLKRLYVGYAPLIMCSALFAIYHGNGIQGIYGFLASAFIIFSYEKCGDIRICIMIHMLFNLSSYVLTYLAEGLGNAGLWAVFGVFLAAGAAGAYLLYHKKDDKKVSADDKT
ncbi:MAG: CPBP family intramembrane metalloprotease [Lachnospiraceae bacterium]|nr:CPBP family intramembrane metalloprotease [Lachnospiraceae bacterium]